MKKTAFALALTAAAGFAGAAHVASGDTSTTGLFWDRPIGAGPAISGLGPVQYEVLAFFVDTSGSYDISEVQDYDGYMHVYATSFDPNDQLANLLAGNDDGDTGIGSSDIDALALSAGTQYFLVTSGFAAGDAGMYTATIDNGPGDATFGLIPAPAGLAVLGLGGIVAGRRRR